MRILVTAGLLLALTGFANAANRDTTVPAPTDDGGGTVDAAARPTQVEVLNFPAVQQVAGEVSITNPPPGTGQFAVVQVAANPGPTMDCGAPCRVYTSDPFVVQGWNVVAAQVVFFDASTRAAGNAKSVAYRNFATDPFGPEMEVDNTASAPVRGAEARASTVVISDANTVSHFSVYLSR